MDSTDKIEPKSKKEYLKGLDVLRKGNFVKVKDFAKRYSFFRHH